jgi:hypothetical protein
MKFLHPILLASLILASGTSQANPNQFLGSQSHLEWSAQTVTKNALARVPLKPHKLVLPRTKKQQAILLTTLVVDDSDYEYNDELDFQVAYRRPELIHHKYNLLDDDEDLPTHITDRLAQIRALAMEKYREVRQT